MNPTKEDRLDAASALCEEFSGLHLPFWEGRIVLLIHRKWLDELEHRLRQIGFRFIRVVPRGLFRVVSVIDMYR